ncbi:nuclear transport factor 2 family protein [Egbenema bharatensis]|uniref:nuclear transport factor 2 family protein n=1 Tax=Egbenema bharatensis TaxID=3463334 RepID=UPI003A83DF83
MKRFPKLIRLASLGLAASLSITSLSSISCSQDAADTAPIEADPQQLVNDYGAALFNPLLVEGFTEQLTRNVEWRMDGDPDRLGYAGNYRGRDAVQEFFTNMARTFLWTGFTPLDILTEEQETLWGGQETRVAVRVAQTGKGTFTGQNFEGDFVYLLTLGEDGRISSFEGFYNTYPAAAAATGVVAPNIPDTDPLTGQSVTVDQTIDREMARQVAIDTWEALIENNLEQAAALNTPDTQWSFAIGGPTFYPMCDRRRDLPQMASR